MIDELAVAVLGFVGGAVGGLLGVGGGVFFVPALVVFLGQGQLGAEATSLLAIVPMALFGAIRQQRLGNLELGDALAIGALSVPGALIGVSAANAVPERALELGFAGLILLIAARLFRRGLAPPEAGA